MMAWLRRALLLVVIVSTGLARPAFAASMSPDEAEDGWLQAASADEMPTAPAPANIAVDPEGDVYVTDYAFDRVLKFASDGTLLQQWGGSGSAMGQLSGPFGVAVDDRGALYVVEQLNNRVQKFATDGTPLTWWGEAGAGHGALRTPFGAAVAGGRVYVADFGNDRVQVFTPEGTPLDIVGARGTGEGQFLRPAGVAVDHEGTLYVSDHFNDRVQKFGADGHFEGLLGSLGLSTPMPTPLGTPVPAPLPAVLPEGQLRRPEGIALDREGNVWVADYGRDRVVKLSADGHFLFAWGGRGSGLGEFVGPKGVAFDPGSGRLYVADTGNARIQRLAPDGTVESWPLPDPRNPSS